MMIFEEMKEGKLFFEVVINVVCIEVIEFKII